MNRISAEMEEEIAKIAGTEYEIIESFPLDMFPELLGSLAGDLTEEEIAAVTGQVGCFSLRLAKVACYNYPHLWEKRKVLPASFTQELRKRMLAGERIEQECDPKANYRMETVLSVCRNDGEASPDAYHYICHAQEAWYGWSEMIDWIGVIRIKNDPVQNTMRFFFGRGVEAQTDSEQELLFVRKAWSGDSHSATYWYVLYEDGTVKDYQFGH